MAGPSRTAADGQPDRLRGSVKRGAPQPVVLRESAEQTFRLVCYTPFGPRDPGHQAWNAGTVPARDTAVRAVSRNDLRPAYRSQEVRW